MARRQPPPRPASYHEPLWPARSLSAWAAKPPTIAEGTDPEEARRLVREFEDAEKHPAWSVWAGGLFDPERSPAVSDDMGDEVRGGGVVCKITRCAGMNESVPSPEHWAKRFAQCVNAFRGIASPGVFLAEVAVLLGEIAADCDFNYGERAGALLAQIKKPVSREEAR